MTTQIICNGTKITYRYGKKQLEINVPQHTSIAGKENVLIVKNNDPSSSRRWDHCIFMTIKDKLELLSVPILWGCKITEILPNSIIFISTSGQLMQLEVITELSEYVYIINDFSKKISKDYTFFHMAICSSTDMKIFKSGKYCNFLITYINKTTNEYVLCYYTNDSESLSLKIKHTLSSTNEEIILCIGGTIYDPNSIEFISNKLEEEKIKLINTVYILRQDEENKIVVYYYTVNENESTIIETNRCIVTMMGHKITHFSMIPDGIYVENKSSGCYIVECNAYFEDGGDMRTLLCFRTNYNDSGLLIDIIDIPDIRGTLSDLIQYGEDNYSVLFHDKTNTVYNGIINFITKKITLHKFVTISLPYQIVILSGNINIDNVKTCLPIHNISLSDQIKRILSLSIKDKKENQSLQEQTKLLKSELSQTNLLAEENKKKSLEILKTVKTKSKEYDTQILQLKTEIQKLSESNAKLSKSKAELSKSNTKLSETNSELSKSNTKLSETKSELSKSNTDLIKLLSKTKAELTKLQECSVKDKTELDKYKKEIATNEDKHKESIKCAIIAGKNEMIDAANDHNQRIFEDLQEQYNILKKDFEDKNADACQENILLNKEISELKADIMSLGIANDKLREIQPIYTCYPMDQFNMYTAYTY